MTAAKLHIKLKLRTIAKSRAQNVVIKAYKTFT